MLAAVTHSRESPALGCDEASAPCCAANHRRSFENSFAACAAPVVGILAEKVFGFSGVLNDKSMADEELRMRNAGETPIVAKGWL